MSYQFRVNVKQSPRNQWIIAHFNIFANRTGKSIDNSYKFGRIRG